MKTFKQIMMWIILLMVIAVIAFGAYLYQTDAPIEYVKMPSETVEVIKTVDPLDEKIAAREAELAEKYEKIKTIEARIDVKEAEVKRLEAEILADKKELSSFMTATASER